MSPVHRDDWLASRRALTMALGLTGSYMVVEVISGLVSNSLALLADAAHMLTDAASIGLALAALWLASQCPSSRYSFGLRRFEVLAVLLNSVSLWALAAWLFLEAYRRFDSPPEVGAPLMLVVGSIGLAVNFASATILGKPARRSLDVEGAFLHVVGDLLGSLGVLTAGTLMLLFNWTIADPIVAGAISFLILISSVRLLRRVLGILLEGTPEHLDLARICERLEAVPGVAGIHDIHTWALTSGYNVMSLHATTPITNLAQRAMLLGELRRVATQLGVIHATIQLEDPSTKCDEEGHHFPHR